MVTGVQAGWEANLGTRSAFSFNGGLRRVCFGIRKKGRMVWAFRTSAKELRVVIPWRGVC